ncbi:MAG: transporter [Firmicutes bacterium HGW-Firmicutes-7]|nr:MAG: transporter [Firmicutes bacterium HGW-Firmicutes-7]
MMKQFKRFNKQYLRSKLSTGASYTEIYISILILIGIIILSVKVFHDLYEMVITISQGTFSISIEYFLSTALELIIGIEFVKMLAKHTPSSVIEVLLFAIARKLITHHGTMLESLIGVIAILLLFAIKKYLIQPISVSTSDAIIVNGALSTEELNTAYGTEIDVKYGNTIAGIISNMANLNNQCIQPGLKVVLGNNKFEVYTMDAKLIKQVKMSLLTNENDKLA